MPTDAALLSQLQTLWRAATPLIVPPAVSTAAPPQPPSASTHSEGTDQESAEHFALGTPDDRAGLQVKALDSEPGADQPRLWVLAEDAARNDGIERDDVPLACRWWRVATFDHLAYGDGRLPAPLDGAEDPFDLLDDQARAYLLGRHRHPEGCGFCGGHYRHNPRCVALCDEWAVAMPFGKHKGRPIRNLDRDYLAWIRKSGMALNGEVAGEIDRVLDQRQGG